MKLSPKQIEYVNKERDHLIQQIKFKEEYNVDQGIWGDKLRLQQINLIIDLHNLEVRGSNETQNNQSGGQGTTDSCM